MRTMRARHALTLLLLALLPAGCQRNEPAAVQGESPEMAARRSIDLLKAGRIGAFWEASLPPADYAAWREEWDRPQSRQTLIGGVDPVQLDAVWRRLKAPGARESLYDGLEPKLSAAEHKYAGKWPLLVNLGQATVSANLERSPTLSRTQRQQLNAMLEVLGPWLRDTPWFDRGRARQALDATVATARQIHPGDPDGLRRLDFDGAMEVYSAAFAGARRVLTIYGLSVEQTLDSVHVVPLDYRPPYARVRIEYTLLGHPLAFESTMIEQGGHWYDEDLVQSVRAARRATDTHEGSGILAESGLSAGP